MNSNEIIGHKDIITRLYEVVKNQHVASALLFTGPEGIGKKRVALHLAQALNCRHFSTRGPCLECASCRKIAALSHPEVKVITKEEKAKSLKIDQIIQLRADISLRPVEAIKKVYIIDDAHILTREASNCLLKTLEEPPLNSLIILVTANPSALLLTIRSRCQKIGFKPLPAPEVMRRLQEESQLGNSQAGFLTDFAGGSLGLAQTYLEKGILEKKAELDDFLKSINEEDIAVVLSQAQSYGRDKEYAKIWLDLILYVCVQRFLSAHKGSDYSHYPEEEIIDLILRAKKDMAVNINLQLVLENIFLRMRHA
ncbi:MAG: DNA polymerase III subunit delta' [bacterium]|nr:DNA polymerase III subunit delta' [bacterium]